MILYKQRRFSELINDTITFLRENGKHFLTLYIQTVGIPWLVMMPFMYYYYKYSSITSQLGLGEKQLDKEIMLFFDKYPELTIVLIVIFILSALIFSVLQNSFIPAYFYYYQQRGKNFTVREIFEFIKERWLRILIYMVIALVMSIPLLLGALVASVLLLVTLVGIVLPWIVLYLWYELWFLDYMLDKRGIFESFSEASRMISTRFWTYVGSAAIFMLISNIVMGGIALIVNLLFLLLSFQSVKTGQSGDLITSIYGIIMVLVDMSLKVFFQLLLGVLMGLIYFSAKEEMYQVSATGEIDQIGKTE